MQAFTTSHKDPLTAAAAGILFSEDVSTIEKKVKNLKVGDKTNFGIVKAIGDTWISFKGKDLGVTKIAFNQRKMGSKDYVLDQLRGMNEDVSLDEDVAAIEKKVATLKVGDKTNFGVVKEIGDKWISFKGKDLGVTKIPFNQRKMGSKDFVLDQLRGMNEELEESVEDKIKKLKVGDKTNFGVVKDISDTAISFKNSSAGTTKIPFKAAKVKNAKTGESGFVLDDLKMESVSLEEGLLDVLKKGFSSAVLSVSDAKHLADEWEKQAQVEVRKQRLGDEEKMLLSVAVAETKKYLHTLKSSKEVLTIISDEKATAELVSKQIQKIKDKGGVLKFFTESAPLEEGISFDAIAKAGKLGMSDAKIDSFVRIHKANGRTDKEINAMLISGKGLKEEAELDEASDILKNVAFQKANGMLDSLEMVLNPNSSIAKAVIKELGAGYAADFKKMGKHLDEIFAIWNDIQMGLSTPTE